MQWQSRSNLHHDSLRKQVREQVSIFPISNPDSGLFLSLVRLPSGRVIPFEEETHSSWQHHISTSLSLSLWF